MVMKFISGYDSVLSALCIHYQKYGIFASYQATGCSLNELQEAVPFVKEQELMDFWHNGEAYFFFDSMKEMQDHFNQIIGEDSDREDIEAIVFAVSCDPFGNLLGENT